MLKVTLPSPSLFANFWDPERAPPEYLTLQDFLADVAELLREEGDELEAMGATYSGVSRRWIGLAVAALGAELVASFPTFRDQPANILVTEAAERMRWV